MEQNTPIMKNPPHSMDNHQNGPTISNQNTNQNSDIANIMNKFFQNFQQPNQVSPMDNQLEQALKLSKQISEKDTMKYEKLENALVSRGLKIFKVNDDGNCLFRALSFLVYGTVDLHADVREKIVNYMRSAKEHYSEFVTDDFDFYLTKMSVDGEYGTNLEVQASVEVFGRPVEVYSDESGAEPLNILQGSHHFETQKPIRISYHRGNHYNAVIPIESEETVIPPTGFGKFQEKDKDNDITMKSDEMFICPYCNQVCSSDEDFQIHLVTTCEVGKGFV